MSRSLFAILQRRFGPRVDALSRREMLRHSAAVGAGLLLSNLPGFTPRAIARPKGKRVVVVGAGFAGLACAHELRSAGYDVSVVEARHRVGGRVLSFNATLGGELAKGKNCEGGAELIGSNHPTWVAYKEKFGLEFLDVTEDEDAETPIILGGRKLTAEESKKLWEEMGTAFERMNADASTVIEDEPWKTPNAAELDKRSVADWLKDQSIDDLGKAGIRAQLVADNGQTLERSGYLGMLSQVKGGGVEKYWTDSEIYRCKGGNQQLAYKLLDAIGKDAVTLKLAVTEIRIRDRNSIVKCADGRTYECDDVVLAVPAATWSKIKIEPDLPAAMKPQVGPTLKYLVGLKKRFWKGSGLNPTALWDGDIGWTWEGSDNQEGDDSAVMVAFSGGPGAEACMRWPKEKRDETYKSQIEKVYAGFSENFNESRFMDWPNEPWSGGGYSFPAPGQVTTVGPLMAKPHAGHLHIAGEHACYKFVGYMEGGLNSGVTIARRIAAQDGIVSP